MLAGRGRALDTVRNSAIRRRPRALLISSLCGPLVAGVGRLLLPSLVAAAGRTQQLPLLLARVVPPLAVAEDTAVGHLVLLLLALVPLNINPITQWLRLARRTARSSRTLLLLVLLLAAAHRRGLCLHCRWWGRRGRAAALPRRATAALPRRAVAALPRRVAAAASLLLLPRGGSGFSSRQGISLLE